MSEHRYGRTRRSLFLNIFGKSPQTRLIDLFLDNPLFEFSKKELIEALAMSKVTLLKTLPQIEEEGIIFITRKIGKANLYKLNPESSIVKSLKTIIREAAVEAAMRERNAAEE